LSVELLDGTQVRVLQDPATNVAQLVMGSWAERHRAMRVASLVSGTPETVDNCGQRSVLRSLAASPDTCTQPRVCLPRDGPLHPSLSKLKLRLLLYSKELSQSSYHPAPWSTGFLVTLRDAGLWALVEGLPEALRMGAPTREAHEPLWWRATMDSFAGVKAVFAAAKRYDQPVLLYRKPRGR
jgi:hypothetical protein